MSALNVLWAMLNWWWCSLVQSVNKARCISVSIGKGRFQRVAGICMIAIQQVQAFWSYDVELCWWSFSTGLTESLVIVIKLSLPQICCFNRELVKFWRFLTCFQYLVNKNGFKFIPWYHRPLRQTSNRHARIMIQTCYTTSMEEICSLIYDDQAFFAPEKWTEAC